VRKLNAQDRDNLPEGGMLILIVKCEMLVNVLMSVYGEARRVTAASSFDLANVFVRIPQNPQDNTVHIHRMPVQLAPPIVGMAME